MSYHLNLYRGQSREVETKDGNWNFDVEFTDDGRVDVEMNSTRSGFLVKVVWEAFDDDGDLVYDGECASRGDFVIKRVPDNVYKIELKAMAKKKANVLEEGLIIIGVGTALSAAHVGCNIS
jgi:hypothetical protein